MWIYKRARYPYVDPQSWTTRAWLLIKKVDRQRGVSSYSDRRVAVELIRLRPKGTPDHLVGAMEEVLCGNAEERPGQQALWDATQEEDLGT